MNKQKKSGLTFIIIIIALVLASTIGGVIGKGVGNAIYSNLFHSGSSKPEIISKAGLTQAHKDGYIKSCIQSGGNETYCECTFDYIKDKISSVELKGSADEYQEGQVLPDIFKGAMATCIFKTEQLLSPTLSTTKSVDTNLEIERCKIARENASVWDKSTKIAEEWNQIVVGLKAQGITTTFEDAEKFYNENVEKYRNELYQNCLNRVTL